MNARAVKPFTLLIFFTLFACQEDGFVPEEQVDDADMAAATLLAEDYLNDASGRFEESERSITVLRYREDKLLFDTNTDDYKGYQEVQETSVTAIVEPGEYIFWFAGGGLEQVNDIEFDGASQEVLEDLPEDFVPSKMWVVRVPERIEGNTVELKYDIVYQPKGGIQIRLDPKIQVHN